MPATATHSFFALDVYSKLNKNIKESLKNEKKAFIMFSQSTDSLMFYNIMNLKKGKKIRNMQYTFHSTKTNEFFCNAINYIKENKFYNDNKTLAFIYGFVCHFCLDSNIHPYIYYKTGEFNKYDKNTLKYNCLHNYIETFFDNYLIEERYNNYKKFNIANICFDTTKFTNELNKTINYTFNKTFNTKYMSKIYYTSLKHMKKFITLFRKDRYGIKKIGYKLIDNLTPKRTFIFDSLSYNQKIIDTNNFLNINRCTWNYPIDKNIKSNKSFKDLYNTSINECVSIIETINNYFFNNKNINIEELFKNKSYITGIDCNIKLKQKYFEF